MSSTSQALVRVALLSAIGLSLAACDTLRSVAGNDKQPPDEFAVVTKAPLIIPPDYNLKPPQPGAAPLNQIEPTQSAQNALFDGDPAVAGTGGNFSPVERTFLAKAGSANADPAIRAELQSDNRSMQGADESFTDRVLFGKTDNGGKAVNADAEAAKAEANRNAQTGAKTQAAATIEKKKKTGGWFDWF